MKIGINEFVRRQTKESSFAYFDGTFEQVAEIAQGNFNNAKVTQTWDGVPRVLLVPVYPVGFYTSTTVVNADTKLESVFEKRRENEEGYIKTVAVGASKYPAHVVEIVLYSHAALAENNEQSTDCEWEIVSINASTTFAEPMHPLTMARNFLEKTGGTKATYTAEQFAEAIWFWKDKVQVK